MQKNYLTKMVKSMMNPLASTSKNWKKSTTTWLIALFVFCGVSDAFGQTTFTNTSNICPPDNNTTGSTSTINATGFTNNIASVTVNIPNIDHTWYDDLDIMLISPTGQRIILMSDCGDDNNPSNNNRNYVFIQGGIALSDGAQPTASGNVSPTNFAADTWPDGAPTITLMNQFIGNPNGNWTLRVIDDAAGDTGCLINGWSITITEVLAPSITSLGAASGCVGSSLVINGTNFTGATAVTIGGTAAASYVVNSATQITATIGTGTTGTVQVTTPGGSATSAATFTVNPLPANPGNPISNSPQCNPPGVTLTRTGTPPAGVTWYWQTVAGGTSTANSAATFVATTSGTYHLRAQNDTTGCWSAGSGSLAITITPSLSAVAGTPAPTNAATGICYAGGSTLTDLTWNAVAGATSYDVYFGAGSLPGTAIANVATNSYTLGTLNANTTYYWQVVPRNACGATSGTPATWTFTTSNAPCVCVPTSANDTYPISNVTFAGINNNSSATVTAGPDYQDFTTISGNVTAGSTYNISVTSTGAGGTNTFYQYVYFDWNNNGNFADDGGPYNLGNYTTATATFNLNITIPLTATIGTIKFRVVNSFNTILNPCATTGYFQMEDYSLNITAPPACTVPTAVPTALVLSAGTPAGTAINGSFTAAAPAPNSYLVVVSTSNIAPSISNGTTYTIGGNAGVGYTVVDTDTNTTFTAGGLNPSTTYYFYVYSMNYLCSGGPLYNATPLTGNLTTGATVPTYCNATTNTPGTRYIDDISFLGMLNGNIYNLNTGFTTTPAPGGYQDWTGLATKPRQAQGGGVNISFESNSRGTWKAWVDWNKDGDFTDAGELVYTSAGVAMITNTFGFIIPSGATPGDYRVRIRTYNAFGNYDPAFNLCDDPAYEYYGDGANHFDSCTQFTSYSQFINAGCGGDNVTFTEYGETEDYLFTVVEMCEANIVTVTDGEICGSGTVNVSVTGTAGTTQYRWYSAETGGALLATTATGSWTTPLIATTTSYWVTALNGSCESLVRTEVIAKISPLPTITFTPSVPEVCGENNVVSITAGGDTELVYLIDENFEGSGLGVFSNDHITSTAYNTQTAWQKKTSTYIPNGSSWYPAISSNFGANHFAIVTSDIGTNGTTIHNALVSPSVSTSTFLDLTLTFRMYFSRYYPDTGATHNPTLEYMQVEVSDNGGAWTSISGGNIVTDQGYGTDFKEFSYDMSAYINRPNIRVRIRYYAQDWYDGAAVDDIKIFGERPLNTAFNYDTATVDAFTNISCAPGTEYTLGTPATTIYIKPTLTQLENATFTIPVSATLSSGCAATGSVVVTNNTKIFKAGTAGTDWNLGSNWSPAGVPTANNCVVIFDNDVNITGTNYTGYGLNLTVKPTGNLNIASSNSSIITDIVNVEAGGVLEIENDASLVQINNVTNTGNIVYKRTAPSIRGFDYVYWSSPVVNQNIGTIYTSPVSGLKYQWNPTVANGNGGQGNWETASGNMQRAKGYIVRGSSNYSMPATNINATFTGVPHNGNIPFTISRGSYTGVPYNGTNGIQITNINDNYNLIGNPYPSAIDAEEFLAANTYHATTNPTGVIYGNVKLWTHGYQPAAIVNPFYGSFAYNYNANDYVTLNYLGASDPIGASNIIKSGQAFFVQMVDGTTGTGNVNFSNSMRLDASNNPYNNSGFFRNANSSSEKHRIWLDLIDANNIASGTLVGYATDATYGFDTFFDAQAAVPGFMKIYSLIGNDVYDIQGRSLPFDQNDQVPLGATFVQAGNYTIALNTIDGLFLDASQNIFLEDKLTNNIHNLKTTPYSFTASVGTFHDRFVLRYTNTVLGNENFENNNNVTVFTNANININSSVETIRSVQIFDLLGRDIAKFDNINNRSFTIQNVKPTQSTLLVKVTLSNGTVVSKKTIY